MALAENCKEGEGLECYFSLCTKNVLREWALLYKHRMAWVGTSRIIKFQHPCHRQGGQLLDQVLSQIAQDLKNFQGQGIQNLSRHRSSSSPLSVKKTPLHLPNISNLFILLKTKSRSAFFILTSAPSTTLLSHLDIFHFVYSQSTHLYTTKLISWLYHHVSKRLLSFSVNQLLIQREVLYRMCFVAYSTV